MSIINIMKDAIFLKENGRTLGAFTLMCAAIGGTSRKMYPEQFDRKEKTGVTDKDAFTNCLNIAISKEIHGNHSEDINKSKIFSFRYKDKNVSFGDIIYKYFRCNLVHEARLPSTIKIISSSDHDSKCNRLNGLRFIVSDDELHLGDEWISFLYHCISHLKVNLSDFGIKNKSCTFSSPSSESEILEFARRTLGITPAGLITYLGGYICYKKNNNIDFDFSNYALVSNELANEIANIPGPGSMVLTRLGILDGAGNLTRKGIEILNYTECRYVVNTEY